MNSSFRAFLVLLLAIVSPGAALAEKKETPPPQPIYDAPMRVVIVRSGISTCEPHCPEWIAAEGEITSATPAAFRKVFKQMGKKKLPIVIRSPGGSIGAALEIGRMIRKRGLDVAVGATVFTGCAPDDRTCKIAKTQNGIYRGAALSIGGFCNSACPMVVAGGVSRHIPNEVYVGIHKPKTVWSNERVWYRETYRVVKGKKKVSSRKIVRRKQQKPTITYGYDDELRSKLTDYYKEMGVDPAIIAESEDTEHENIRQLSGNLIGKLKLRTTAEGVHVLASPTLCTTEISAPNCVRNKGE